MFYVEPGVLLFLLTLEDVYLWFLWDRVFTFSEMIIAARKVHTVCIKQAIMLHSSFIQASHTVSHTYISYICSLLLKDALSPCVGCRSSLHQLERL
ncbi:hypothetical protein XELAEV_18023688mg [Xenopus laevis]|uniref:Uncharacterized protein n=1 Tax=Xenopus laevis TaxID=8355 RepID=A0A974HPC3_XENLA|nr:hypothetical protein XELAEV_18023688mg [Xenopus laevis]